MAFNGHLKKKKSQECFATLSPTVNFHTPKRQGGKAKVIPTLINALVSLMAAVSLHLTELHHRM
jgi:hypothetical protein